MSLAICKLCWRYQPQPPESILHVEDLKEAKIGFEYIADNNDKITRGVQLYRQEALACASLEVSVMTSFTEKNTKSA